MSDWPHDELDKWAEALPDRRKVEDFLDWLDEQRMEVAVWADGDRWPRPVTESRDSLLNRYFEIDAKRLDDQRRALLKAHTAAAMADPPSRRGANERQDNQGVGGGVRQRCNPQGRGKRG